MKTSINGLSLIKHYSECFLTATRDVGGPWIIGYGYSKPTHNGTKLARGYTISQEEADRLLALSLEEKYEPEVLRLIHSSPTTQNQFDAMISLAFNIGLDSFQSSSIAKQHRLGNYRSASAAFELWSKKLVKGVLTYDKPQYQRRLAEANLYLTPDGGNAKVEAIMQNRIKKAIATDFQIALKRHKLYEGALDGIWGNASEKAYDDFLKLTGELLTEPAKPFVYTKRALSDNE